MGLGELGADPGENGGVGGMVQRELLGPSFTVNRDQNGIGERGRVQFRL